MKHSILLLLALCLAAVSCKKDSNNDDQNTSDAEFFFLGKIDGQSVRLEVTPTNDIEMSTSNSGSIGTPNCVFGYGAFLAPFDINAFPQAGIDFSNYFDGDCSNEETVFNSLFPTGNHAFLNEAVGGKGVQVSYIDASGVYSSAKGTQSAAQFTITKSEVANDPFGLSQTITGTMKCTLYDEFGNKKEFTDGAFRLNFRSYF
ncbi:MAG TPA: hypothetical protein PKL15_05095 [Saprospiraceae bacterium]|nr:hypothetical protein [Saprospiraceae bacterium]